MKKRILSLLLCVSMIVGLFSGLTVTVGATEVASGDCGENVTWALDEEGTLTISGTGAMADYLEGAPWYSYRTQIRRVIIEDGVTSIGYRAFSYCGALTEITIPDSVTSIGEGAFEGCRNLASVVIPDGVTSIGGDAFYNCKSIQSITIPDGVTSISYRAFYGCTALTEITIPDSVTSIGNYAFEDCTALTDVNYGGTQEQWNAITIGDGNQYLTGATIHVAEPEPTVVASGTCEDDLTWTLDDEGTLTISGTGAMTDFVARLDTPWYRNRSSIMSVVIEDGVTSIGKNAFGDCSCLASVVIPASVTSIGSVAFEACSALTEITIPASVTTIGSFAFNLTPATLSLSPENTAFSLADGVLFTADGTELVWYPCSKTDASYVVPDGVTMLRAGAFANVNLASITLSSSVRNLAVSTFYGSNAALTEINVAEDNTVFCSVDGVLFSKDKTVLAHYPQGKVGAYEIPSGVTRIFGYAFDHARQLTEVTIPASMATIGDNVFRFCTALTDVNYGGTQEQWNAITIGSGNQYLTGATIHVTEPTPGPSATEVADKAALNAALAAGTEEITLTADIDYNAALTIPEGVTLYLNGFNLYVTGLVLDGELAKNGGKLWANVSAIAMLTAQPTVADVTNIYAAQEILWASADFDGVRLTADIDEYGVKTVASVDGGYATTREAYMPSFTAAGGFPKNIGVPYSTFKIPAGKTLDLNGHTFKMYAASNRIEGTGSISNSATFGEGTIIAGGGKIVALFYFATGSAPNLHAACALAAEQPGVVTMFKQTSGALTYADPIPSGVSLAVLNSAVVSGSVVSATFLLANEADFTRAGIEYATTLQLACDVDAPTMTFCVPDGVTFDCNGHVLVCAGFSCAAANYVEDGGYVLVDGRVFDPNNVPVGATEVASGTCGENLTWTLDDEGVLTISGTGNMTNWTYSLAVPWSSYRTQIQRVIIEDGVTSIGGYAFSYCTALTEITIPASVTKIGDIAFSDCTALTEITIPDGVTSIGDSAFFNCTGLTSVTIPDGVTSIRDQAFVNCTALTEITIPDSVRSIGQHVFAGCTALMELNVSSGNTVYSSQDGVLYNRDKTALICCLVGKSGSFTVPDSVTSIRNSAFSRCTGLQSVTIPDSVTSIGNAAFYRCTALESVTIGDGVTSIGSIAFDGCTALTDVYYGGTEAQWNAIEIGSDNTALTAATIHFTEPAYVLGDVNGDGYVNTIDASLVVQFYVDAANHPLTSATQLLAADVDGNGHVNTIDAAYILRHFVGSCDETCPIQTVSEPEEPTPEEPEEPEEPEIPEEPEVPASDGYDWASFNWSDPYIDGVLIPSTMSQFNKLSNMQKLELEDVLGEEGYQSLVFWLRSEQQAIEFGDDVP